MPRADDIRMTDDEVRAHLRAGHTMILVSNGVRGHPHAVPMFYGIDDDLTVRLATYGKSQKIKNIERDPRVTLLVESGSAYAELKGVMIEGDAEIVRDLDATVDTMVEAMGKTETRLPPASELPWEVKQKMAGKRVLIRVRPRRFSSWDHAKLPSGKTPGAL